MGNRFERELADGWRTVPCDDAPTLWLETPGGELVVEAHGLDCCDVFHLQDDVAVTIPFGVLKAFLVVCEEFEGSEEQAAGVARMEAEEREYDARRLLLNDDSDDDAAEGFDDL